MNNSKASQPSLDVFKEAADTMKGQATLVVIDCSGRYVKYHNSHQRSHIIRINNNDVSITMCSSYFITILVKNIKTFYFIKRQTGSINW